MPSSNGEGPKQIVEAVNHGKLSEEKLDQAVERLLHVIFKAVDSKREHASYNQTTHHQLTRRSCERNDGPAEK